MRPFHKTFALLGILLPACNLETPFPENLVSPEECTVNVTVGQEPLTKSILPSGIENRLDNAFVLVTGADGFSRYKYFDFTSAQQSPSVNWRMPAGRDYTVYAVGNMGNISPSLPQTEEGIDMTAFRYEVPAYSSLTALPMAKVVSLPAGQLTPGASILLSITLERLMARVNVRINKSGITGGVAAQALQSASLHLRQVAKALYPFRAGGSLALTDADVFSGDTDYYVFSEGEAWDLNSGEITLYIPENRQGQLLGGNNIQARKSGADDSLAALPQKKRLTYLEFISSKNGRTDGVSGGLVYREYLGGNETNDFSVVRNRSFTATLNLTWNGFTLDADGWRVQQGEDWNDARRLAFLDADGNALELLKIHKKGSGEAYAYYAIDGDDGNGTPGRKDVVSYPYGWYLTGNGLTLSGHDGSEDQYTVADGLTVQCLGDTTVGGKAVTRLRFAASAVAAVTTEAVSERHVFGLHTMDGARHGASLQLEIEDSPFEFDWVSDGVPSYIAQKGILRCIDPYSGDLSDEGVFHIKEGYSSQIRLSDNGDGTAAVSIIGPFDRLADALLITDADGDRACPVSLEGIVPLFSCTRVSGSPIYVDGSTDLKFTFYASETDDSKVLKVSDDDSVIKCGDYLDAALVQELIAPDAGSIDGKLGFEPSLAADGSILLNTFIDNYEGLLPGKETYFFVDEARIGMKGYGKPVTMKFYAYDPWRYIAAPVQGATMNDYTLYHEPRGWDSQAQVGWEASPVYKPVETGSYSLEVGKVVVADAGNIQMDARFNDGGGYLGHKLFTGAPNKIDSDYSATWKLTYSMAGLQEGDIVSHNAGKALVVLQVVNPHNPSSPPLERVLAETYIRLHLYVWPAVFDLLRWHGSHEFPSTGTVVTEGWVFEAYPFAFTEGKRIHGLENEQYENFFSLSVLKAQEEVFTNFSSADLVSTSASQGTIARDISARTGMAVWRFKDEHVINVSGTEADPRDLLMEALSGVHKHTPPFLFKTNDELASVLGGGTFFRQDEVTLYYDPSGSERIYSTGAGDKAKLFVIHFGGGQELHSSYYFDPINGF